jgi:hypothetical protein
MYKLVQKKVSMTKTGRLKCTVKIKNVVKLYGTGIEKL